MKVKIVVFLIFSILILFITFPKNDNKKLNTYYPIEKELITVTLEGEVVYPGAYQFYGEKSLNEILNFAGGLLPTANKDALSLNSIISKSITIIVNKDENADDLRININTATLDELIKIPHIGEQTATNIIDYRLKNGFFSSYEELLNVKNIGNATLEKIKPYIRFN